MKLRTNSTLKQALSKKEIQVVKPHFLVCYIEVGLAKLYVHGTDRTCERYTLVSQSAKMSKLYTSQNFHVSSIINVF